MNELSTLYSHLTDLLKSQAQALQEGDLNRLQALAGQIGNYCTKLAQSEVETGADPDQALIAMARQLQEQIEVNRTLWEEHRSHLVVVKERLFDTRRLSRELRSSNRPRQHRFRQRA